jgi:N-acetylmuramoyl-L-alanine amidase
MRRAPNAGSGRYLLLLLLALLNLSTATFAQDLLIESESKRFRVQAREFNQQIYYSLSELATVAGCKLETQEDSALIEGPGGTLYLTDGRALIRFNTEYVLLSSAPWRASYEEWYVAEDFVARALALILDVPLRPAGSGRYLLGSVMTGMQLELINRPDQVRLIFRPRQHTPISLMEYSDRIEVAMGSGKVAVQLPPIQPNAEIVYSISQDEDFLIIRKGPRFDRFEESQPMKGPGFIIDLFGIPSAIVSLPPRSSKPTDRVPPEPRLTTDTGIAGTASNPFDQLQDWRWGPIERRKCSVVIDPGHGGLDSGVTLGDLAEKDITLEIAFRVQDILEREGHSCQLTRSRDVALAVEQRSGVANYHQPEVFISIHVGGSPSAATRSSTIYLDHGSRVSPDTGSKTEIPTEHLIPWRLAQQDHSIQSAQLGVILQQRIRGVSESPTLVAKAPLAVLSPVNSPAVLLEVGYLTNPSQRAKLQSEEHRARIADAIAEAIMTFLQEAGSADPGEE